VTTPPLTSSPARLVWEKADGSQVEFPLTADIHHVGREEPADIQVSEPLVSRSHARLERRGEAWVLLDLGSTNFTRVNGNRIGEAVLQEGDEVRFGRARCVFRNGGERAEPEAAATDSPPSES
jgi:pSer/pThr/pTyr-binding forkhead associated (FHA) protein